MVRHLGRTLGAVATGACVLAVGPAIAATGVIDWPTFFRTGPGQQFVVMQELSRGEVVDVLGCADLWCSVQVGRVVGYVEQANLVGAAPPTAAAVAPQTATGCFDSHRSGYQDGENYHYCPR